MAKKEKAQAEEAMNQGATVEETNTEKQKKAKTREKSLANFSKKGYHSNRIKIGAADIRRK